MNRLKISSALAGLLTCTLLSTGCASNAGLRGSVLDRDAEIRQLREERARLKERIQTLAAERENLEVSLSDAALRLTEQPMAVAPSSAFPELDDLGLDYGTRDGQMVIILPSVIAFKSGKAELSSSGETALRAVAARLKSEFTTEIFHVEGHTDSDPIQRSDFASNRALSLERSVAVLTFLVEQCEVPDERFVVVGHGQYRPIASNDNAEGKSRNRRVEIVIHESL
ncbi:MAG: chemotaxis protein MotB [Chlamydiales bacterium]|jgi:chemotaxis protein MotB